MMSKRIVACVATLVVSVAQSTRAQDSTHRLDVTLSSTECERAKDKIFIVIGGNDLDNVDVDREEPEKRPKRCHWTGLRQGPPFSVRDTFSVRFRDGTRSECRNALAIYDHGRGSEPKAVLRFSYRPNTAQDVVVTPTPPKIAIDYTRYVREDDSAKGSVACQESAAFSGEEATLRDVKFSLENVRLRFKWEKHAEDSIEFALDQALQKQIEKGRTLLGPAEIVDAVARQTVEQPSSNLRAPVAEIDLNTKKLAKTRRQKVGLEGVTLRSPR